MTETEAIAKIRAALDVQKVVMLEKFGRPDCKICSLAEIIQKILDELV